MLLRTLVAAGRASRLTAAATSSTAWLDLGPVVQPRPAGLFSFAARHLASSAPSDGPPPSKLAAIPFRISRDAADAAFAAHHTAHALLPRRPPHVTRVDASFQPFWAVAIGGTAVLDGATLGFDRYERVYDPGTRRWRAEVRTVWRKVVIPRRTWRVEASPADPGMQVPASFRYPASAAAVLRPGADLEGAGPVAGALRAPLPGGGGGGDGGTAAARVVDPFELPPAAAVAAALAHATSAEAARAGAALRAEYRADRVGGVDLDIQPSSISASPVWAPAFVFHWSHYGTPLATLVSGLDPSRVAGDRALDEIRVAGVAAAAAGVAMLAVGGPPAWFGGGLAAWAFGLALPAAAASLAAHWAPWAGARLAASEAGAARRAARGVGGMDEPYVAGAAEAAARARADRARAREREEEASYASIGAPAGPPGDPRGYYQALGVRPGATTREVQAAYRGLALSTHPDRVPDGEKAGANARFSRINEAYGVLRDPAKRRAYDGSG